MTFALEDITTNAGTQHKSPVVTGAMEEMRFNEFLKRGTRERFQAEMMITPRLAATMLKRNTHNRPISSHHVRRLTEILLSGRWRATTQGITFDRNGILMDGQHRLAAVAESGVSSIFVVWFGDDPQNFQFVDQGNSRTAGHISAIAGYDYYTTRAASAGIICRLQKGNIKFTPDPQTIFSIVKEMDEKDPALMRKALHFGDAASRAKICGVSACATAYWWIATHSAHASLLPDFADKFLTGANLPARSPILLLRDHIAFKLERNTRQLSVKQISGIILAWNAWVSGKKLRSVNWPHVNIIPEVL